jgi:hypothetical protein
MAVSSSAISWSRVRICRTSARLLTDHAAANRLAPLLVHAASSTAATCPCRGRPAPACRKQVVSCSADAPATAPAVGKASSKPRTVRLPGCLKIVSSSGKASSSAACSMLRAVVRCPTRSARKRVTSRRPARRAAVGDKARSPLTAAKRASARASIRSVLAFGPCERRNWAAWYGLTSTTT